MFFVRILSLVFSGVAALLEEDFKKLVALSTLSQIAFCILAVARGSVHASYFHLMGHAFVKSCLFLRVGYLIYISLGQQDFRSCLSPVSASVRLVLFSILLSLCGLLFSSISLSKDWVIVHLSHSSTVLVGLGYVLIFLTFLYSGRL